jgi:hypothetical protein
MMGTGLEGGKVPIGRERLGRIFHMSGERPVLAPDSSRS